MYSISWLSHLAYDRKSSARTLLAKSELSAGSSAGLVDLVEGFAAFTSFACLSFDLPMALVESDIYVRARAAFADRKFQWDHLEGTWTLR